METIRPKPSKWDKDTCTSKTLKASSSKDQSSRHHLLRKRPLELSECTLWIEGPTWLTEDDESENDEFNNKQLLHECLEEMNVEDEEKYKVETLSLLLVTAEATGIAKIMKCGDYSELERLLRVTGLILEFVKQTQEQLTSQDIAAVETLRIM